MTPTLNAIAKILQEDGLDTIITPNSIIITGKNKAALAITQNNEEYLLRQEVIVYWQDNYQATELETIHTLDLADPNIFHKIHTALHKAEKQGRTTHRLPR